MNQDTNKIKNISYLLVECLRTNLPQYGVRFLFPRNCCEESSIILLHILESEGINNFNLIKGTNKSGEHHFWLESNQHIIDLTAHQFDEIKEPMVCISKEDHSLSTEFFDQSIEKPPTNWKYFNELKPRILSAFSEIYNVKK